MDFADTVFAESAPFQSNSVQAVGTSVPRTDHGGERQNVFGAHGVSADVGVRAHAAKLVDRTESADYRPLFHGNVSGQRGGVDQHGMVAHKTIVADVSISEKQNVAAYRRHASAFGCSAVDGHVFAKRIVVANAQLGFFPGKGGVLRFHANGAEREEAIVRSDLRWPMNNDVGHELTIFAEFHVGPNNAVRPNHAG